MSSNSRKIDGHLKQTDILFRSPGYLSSNFQEKMRSNDLYGFVYISHNNMLHGCDMETSSAAPCSSLFSKYFREVYTLKYYSAECDCFIPL